MDNADSTLALNAATGSWKLDGGGISGGTVTIETNISLLVSNQGGRLSDVHIAGEVVFQDTAANVLLEGSTTFSALRVRGANSFVRLGFGFTLTSLISFESTSGQQIVYLGYDGVGTVTIAPTGIIRSTSSITFRNGVTGTFGTLENNGLISSEGTGSLIFDNTVVVNTGTIQTIVGSLLMRSASYTGSPTSLLAGGSGSTVTISATNWTHLGAMMLDTATLNLGGTFPTSGFNLAAIARSAGTVNLTGTLNNTGSTLALTATTGSWNLSGGSIIGGTLTFANGSTLVTTFVGGTIADVIVAGDLVLSASNAALTLKGAPKFDSVRMIAKGSILTLAAGTVLNSLVLVEGGVAGTRTISLASGGSGLVTFGPGAVLRIAANSGGSLKLLNGAMAVLVNNGIIESKAPGQTLTIQAYAFTNNGTVDAAGGNIQITGTLANIVGGKLEGGVWKASASGSLSGAAGLIATLHAQVVLDGAAKGWDALNALVGIATGGTLQLSAGTDQAITPPGSTFTNNGTLILGVGSTLLISGGFSQSDSGLLRSLIAGRDPNSSFGSVTASGPSSFAGALELVAVNGYVPVRYDVQDVVKGGGVATGTFATATFPPPANSEWKSGLVYTGTGVRLVTTSIIDFDFDGQVDLQDYFEFFNRWDLNDPSLDLNHDGAIDLGDFFLFFNLWSSE